MDKKIAIVFFMCYTKNLNAKVNSTFTIKIEFTF